MRITYINSKEKLAKLCEIEGYETPNDLLKHFILDCLSPAICMEANCNYTCEMEPDQDHGYCEECKRNSVVSAMVLADVI
jgi:hypothetical protein